MLGFDSLFSQYQPKCLVLWIWSLAKGGSPMSRNFYMPTRVGKTEAVYGRSRVNLKVKRGSTFYVYERPCIQIAAILFTRVKVLCAYAHKNPPQRWKSTPKVVVHGGLTCYQVFSLERTTISIRNSVKGGIIRTSEAHSCSVPTTGISIASLLDLSSLANRGIPSAFLMACLFLVLLLQLHKASAPQRATSACMADALARDPQSRSAT